LHRLTSPKTVRQALLDEATCTVAWRLCCLADARAGRPSTLDEESCGFLLGDSLVPVTTSDWSARLQSSCHPHMGGFCASAETGSRHRCRVSTSKSLPARFGSVRARLASAAGEALPDRAN
jgi:hypothetical protein